MRYPGRNLQPGPGLCPLRKRPCLLSQEQLIQPAFWPVVQSHLRAQAAFGRTAPASTTTFAAAAAGPDKWCGGVLSPQSLIYGFPFDQANILLIDPSNDATGLIPSPGSGVNDFIGGAVGFNGKIYGIPWSEPGVLVFNPVTNSTTTIAAPGTGTTDWKGGVLAPNGKINGIPSSSASVLKISTGAVGRFCDAVSRSGYWNFF